MITAIAFYAFSAVLLASATMVISARNPVHAALYLILAFFNAAALFLIAGAEFLAMILVIVYVGAVAVLFLFVVMMLDINMDTMREGFWKHFPLAAGLGALIALEMAAVLMGGFRISEAPSAMQAGLPVSNAKALGILLYTDYLMPIQIGAVILLVAMITAIALTLRERKDSKAINASIQVRVRAADRLSIIKVGVTQAGQAPQAIAAPGTDAAPQENKS
jgi:NADH-quinone oxidoreductase subunit J